MPIQMHSVWNPLKPNKRKLTESIQIGTDKIPYGFVWDGASVPRIFHWVLPRWGVHEHIYCRHDYRYSRGSQRGTRKQADKIMFNDMKDNGVCFVRRYLVYLAVRLVGFTGFDN